MGEHSRISPSGLDALALCPGKLHAEEAIKVQPGWVEKPNKAAEDGTRRHLLAEWRQKNPTAAWPIELNGQQITSEDVEAVKTVIPYVIDHPALQDKVSGQRWIEHKVEIGKWIGLPEGLITGTIDVLFASRHTLEVLDWKFGRHVRNPDCLQLKAYGIGGGALLDWGGRHRGIDDKNGTVRLTIGQPANPKVIDSVDFGINALEGWGVEIKRVAEAALDPKAPRIPGDDQCHFCLANGSCRERLALKAQGMFEPVGSSDTTSAPTDLPPVATVDAIAEITDLKLTQEPQGLSDEELGKLVDQAGLLEGFLKSARKELTRRLKLGQGVNSGWKLVPGRKKRSWTEDDSAVEKMLRGCGLKVAEIYPKEIPSVPKAEAMVKVKGHKAVARMNNMVKVEDGAPVLAPQGDSRPSIAETMFDPLETSTPAQSADELPDWAT